MTQDFTKDYVLEALREKLPPVFPRRCVEVITGGLIKVHTLANLDSMGQGPGYFKIGKRVGYEKETFLKWFEQRLELRGEGKA